MYICLTKNKNRGGRIRCLLLEQIYAYEHCEEGYIVNEAETHLQLLRVRLFYIHPCSIPFFLSENA